MYPLADPTWNDAATSKRFGSLSARDFDDQLLVTKNTLDEIAAEFNMDRDTFRSTVADWNAGCAAKIDKAFGRVPGSMMPIAEPPFSAGFVWPVVSNTQGGIPHDAEQRVLNSFDEPIRRLFVAGELGSVLATCILPGETWRSASSAAVLQATTPPALSRGIMHRQLSEEELGNRGQRRGGKR